MPVAINDMELDVIMFKLMTDVVDEVTWKLLEQLKDKINTIVYNPYHPKKYVRHKYNGGLLENWIKTPALAAGRTITGMIDQDPYSMILDQGEEIDEWPYSYPSIHGSKYTKKDGDQYEKDIRETLSEIIIKGWSGSRFGKIGFWKTPRDFWSPFIELLNNGTVEGYIEKAFRSRGIKYIKN
jgi:hypothetical protein